VGEMNDEHESRLEAVRAACAGLRGYFEIDQVRRRLRGVAVGDGGLAAMLDTLWMQGELEKSADAYRVLRR